MMSAAETSEPDEILQDLRKISMPCHLPQNKPIIGDIVRWIYEWVEDPLYGSLYIVAGFHAEVQDIAVVRVLNNPFEVREFHVSQLETVSNKSTS
jgi:hypothetical protein